MNPSVRFIKNLAGAVQPRAPAGSRDPKYHGGQWVPKEYPVIVMADPNETFEDSDHEVFKVWESDGIEPFSSQFNERVVKGALDEIKEKYPEAYERVKKYKIIVDTRFENGSDVYGQCILDQKHNGQFYLSPWAIENGINLGFAPFKSLQDGLVDTILHETGHQEVARKLGLYFDVATDNDSTIAERALGAVNKYKLYFDWLDAAANGDLANWAILNEAVAEDWRVYHMRATGLPNRYTNKSDSTNPQNLQIRMGLLGQVLKELITIKGHYPSVVTRCQLGKRSIP